MTGHPVSHLVTELLDKHPDVPARTAARVLRQKHPGAFASLDAARRMVRYVRGTSGAVDRAKRKLPHSVEGGGRAGMSETETQDAVQLKAPFPWFGGKSRAASLIWARFGDVRNYVEPFAGSLAVLLSRPHPPQTETVNDLDCYLANFWRAVAHDPEETARWADWPVNEADLIARHRWLVARSEFRERMLADPDFYDAKTAGWWVWGLCAWIGSGWCSQNKKPADQLPHLGNAGMGINRKLPHLGDAGRGINRKLPHLGDAGRGEYIRETFTDLSVRLRNVRVACSDWTRVLSPAVTIKHGTTAVLLDPPYDAAEHNVTYSADSNVSGDVRAWAIANGDNPSLRIALCGYEGEHAMPDSWECVAWKAAGGYGSQGNGRGKENAHRERVWFSPACIRPERERMLI